MYQTVSAQELDDYTVWSESDLTKRTKHLNNLHNHFWKRCLARRTLLELRECHRYNGRNSCAVSVAKGYVVLVLKKTNLVDSGGLRMSQRQ